MISQDIQSKYGSLHYLFYLFTKDVILNPDDDHDDDLYLIETDINGNKYKNNELCLTEQCLFNEIDQLHGSNTYFDQLPLSVRHLIALPYILPALVIVIAILSIIIPYCYM